VKRILFVLIAAGFAVFFSTTSLSHSRAALSTTPACGLINSNTTWSLASSPYDVCPAGVAVNTGATLTIDPGVTVLFEQGSGDKLSVLGTLEAMGTSTQPITMTAVVLTPGSWRGISVDGSIGNPAVANLQYVTLEYGGDNGSYGALIYSDHANVTVNYSLLRNGPGRGIYTTNNTQFSIQNTSFQNNALEAVSVHTPSVDLLMTNLTASGNGTDGVFVTGTTSWPGIRHWTNPGIPYVIDGQMINAYGDSLTIDPGSILKFTAGGFINIAGELKAQGTATNPILMTGVTQTPGAWRGIYVYGGTQQAVAQLDYATLEYGGSDVSGANIYVYNGKLIAHYSTIRYSSKDGIRFDSNAGGMILNSQVYGNGNYGVYNGTPTRGVLATNTWWGDAGGPVSDIPQCSSGLGDKVTAGVLFVPVLTSPGATNTLPLSDAPNLSMTPRRWFAPADGTTKIYFDITLVDGNGYPLPGRMVRLHSNLGTVTDGGITDANGKTLAYLTSNSTGDAQVYASLDSVTACEGSLSPDATVTFTTPATYVNLFADDSSPYTTGDIWVTPLPVVVGVPTTIHARLTNPLTTPVTTDVEFDYAQAGIGLAFGPIQNFTSIVIQPQSSIVLSAMFGPPISGHYCVQVSYTVTNTGAQNAVIQAQRVKQFNINAQQGTPIPSDSKDSLNKANQAFNKVKQLPAGPTQIQKGMIDEWWGWVKDTASKISQALGFDPARQDYTTPTIPVWHRFNPVQPSADISPQRAAALNAVSDALFNIQAYGTAATTALDRYAGASAAGDLTWASAQSNEMLYYEQQLGSSLVTYADNLDALVAVLQAEGETQTVITLADVINYQTRLATSGFTQQEIADAHQAGLADSDIEAYRQEIIASSPADIAGDLISIYTSEAATARETGNAILHPAVFNPGYSVGGTGGSPQVVNNLMAQVYDLTSSFILSNPNATTSVINLTVRRIGLPADWTVDVSPAQVSLDPGQQVTVTVSVVAGSPLPQGSRPRLAVEGYVNGQLLGGVALDIVVPQYRPFDGFLRTYLSLVSK
jgi:Bacterial Ig-like domain (group 1)